MGGDRVIPHLIGIITLIILPRHLVVTKSWTNGLGKYKTRLSETIRIMYNKLFVERYTYVHTYKWEYFLLSFQGTPLAEYHKPASKFTERTSDMCHQDAKSITR